MNFTIRPITGDEVAAFRACMVRAFGGDPRETEEDRFRATVELERTVAALDGGGIVGTLAAFSFDVTVPGAAVPMGGTTMVSVQPTHRRRGALRAMMDAHLDEVRDRGEPLAGLWASEASIYGRFGFGAAAEACEVKIDAPTVTLLDDGPEPATRLVTEDQARALLPEVFERVRPGRPGMLSRSEAWWTAQAMADPEHWRAGRSAKRYVVAEADGRVDGYVVYRQKEKWEQFPEGEVHVTELVAATAGAHRALWRLVTNIDLFPRVSYWNMPVDDPLPWCVTESRRVVRTPGDSLWLRIMHVPAALTARSYSAEGRLVLGVHDPFRPANDGRYELEAGADGAVCRATTAAPDVELAIDALGALYLGGHRFTTLARAGRVTGDLAALQRADRMFTWHTLPWCPEIF